MLIMFFIKVITIYCGRKIPGKSDAYVSAAKEVLQPKFIDDFLMKCIIDRCSRDVVIKTVSLNQQFYK